MSIRHICFEEIVFTRIANEIYLKVHPTFYENLNKFEYIKLQSDEFKCVKKTNN